MATSTARVSTCRSSWPSRSRHTCSASWPNCIASTWPPRRCSRLTWSIMRRAQGRVVRVEEAAGRTQGAAGTGRRPGRCCPGPGCPGWTRQQRVGGRAVRAERVGPVVPEPALGDGLDYPVHLDQVPGAVHPGQRQPVQLAGGGAEPLRGGEELAQAGRIVDGPRVLQEQVRRDRLRREERAQVEQVLGVGGQQRGGHRPGGRDRGREVGPSCSLSSRWAFSVEPGQVVLDALAGFREVRRGVLDRDGQVAERGGEPRGLAGPPRVFVLGEPSRSARLGTLRRRKLTASSSVKGGTSMLSASM